MEPADKPSLNTKPKHPRRDATPVDFLPDADEIERRPLPRSARITLHLLLLTLVAFLVWASFSEIDRVVVARGRLVTPRANIVVQPLETSIIQSLDVRIGQIVKKGEVLASLDPTFATADQTQLRKRLASLETQSLRLEAELAGKSAAAPADDPDTRLQASLANERQANYRAQTKRMDESIARLRASIDTNRGDQQMLTTRVKSLKEMEAMQEKLVLQQYGARMPVLEARERRQEVERDLLLTQNHQVELERELASLEAERAAFDKGWRQKTMEDLLATNRQVDELKEELQKADKRQNLITLLAPADAVVLDIARLSPGSIARGGDPLFTLVPLDAELLAEVQIDSLDVGYVKRGDPVHIKLDAFPFQRHGALDAEVATISEDAFKRDTNAGAGLDAYYLARINLHNTRLKRMPDYARILPGMTLSAEIVVGQRTIMSYIIWPFTKALDESIREP